MSRKWQKYIDTPIVEVTPKWVESDKNTLKHTKAHFFSTTIFCCEILWLFTGFSVFTCFLVFFENILKSFMYTVRKLFVFS